LVVVLHVVLHVMVPQVNPKRVQSAHTPLVPQAFAAAPAWQVFVTEEQQLPLQLGVNGSQLVLQVFVAASQELPIGQSVAVLQPQKPPLALGSQAWPMLLVAHAVHAAVSPQARGAVPAVQVVPEQQPPLHAE
jgi:hypothetical protein